MINIHLQSEGVHCDVSRREFCIYEKGILIQSIPPQKVKQIFVYPRASISTNGVLLAHDLHKQVIWCRENGQGVSSSYSPYLKSHAFGVREQLRICESEEARRMAAGWIIEKIKGRITLLDDKVFQIRTKPRWVAYQAKVSDLLSVVEDNPILVFDHEGWISKSYFSYFSRVLPMGMQFQRRSRKPAVDLANACLNYLYGIFYHQLEAAIMKVGLDPYIGFHHSMRKRQKAFLFDVIEPYRPWCESLLLREGETLVRLEAAQDKFMAGGYLLSIESRKLLTQAFYDAWQQKRTKVNSSKVYKTMRTISKEIIRIGRQ